MKGVEVEGFFDRDAVCHALTYVAVT
jgi:hypothetical protein